MDFTPSPAPSAPTPTPSTPSPSAAPPILASPSPSPSRDAPISLLDESDELQEQNRIYEAIKKRRAQEEADLLYIRSLIESEQTSAPSPSPSPAPPPSKRPLHDDMSGMLDLAEMTHAMAETAPTRMSPSERLALIGDNAPLQQLSDMFPELDLGVLQSLLDDNAGDVGVVTAQLLGEPRRGLKGSTDSLVSPQVAKLQFLFPSAPPSMLSEALKTCSGDVDRAAALLLGEAVGPAPPTSSIPSGLLTTSEMEQLARIFPSATADVLTMALKECENDVALASAWLLGERTRPSVPRFVPPSYHPSYPAPPFAPLPEYSFPKGKLPEGFKLPPPLTIDWDIPAQSLLRHQKSFLGNQGHGMIERFTRGFRKAPSVPNTYGAPKTQIETAANGTTHKEWAKWCFLKMVEREQLHFGDYFVVYHSYSLAGLLYECHAVLAGEVYRNRDIDSMPAPLPRLLSGPFAEMPLVSMLVEDFKAGKYQGQDHDPRFRALAISSSVSLLGEGTEAPPLTCFEGGYSCGDLSFRDLLVGLFTTCGLDKRKADKLTDEIVAIGARYGLSVAPYRTPGHAMSAAPPGSVSYGHILQIFIKKSNVDDVAYPSAAMGVPEATTLSAKLGAGNATGQARIFMHPEFFLDPSRARVYHYAANPLLSCEDAKIPGSRAAMLNEIRAALSIITDVPGQLQRASLRIRGLQQ